jgi:hypothetical protein
VSKAPDRTYARKLFRNYRKAMEAVKMASDSQEKLLKEHEALLVKRAKKTKGFPTLSEKEELDYELDRAEAGISLEVAHIAQSQAYGAFKAELQQIALRTLPKEIAVKVAEALKLPIYGGVYGGAGASDAQPPVDDEAG